MIEPRCYQSGLVDESRDQFAAGAQGVVVQLCTGGGKTLVGGMVADRMVRKSRRGLFVAHMRQLVEQASRKLTEYGVPNGILRGGYLPDAPIHVASIQYLARHLNDLPHYDLIIPDEAHHCVSASYRALFDAQRTRILGLTATPWRTNGQGLGRQCGGSFDAMVCGPSVRELQDMGVLSRARVFAPQQRLDVTVPKRGGDYEPRALSDFMLDKPGVTGDAIEHYFRLANGKTALVYCVSVAHAVETARRFQQIGLHAAAISGDTPQAERDYALARLGLPGPWIVCSCDIISEGVDCPVVGAVILLRPTASLVLHYQQIGRGLRVASGKTHVVVIDAVGNHWRHGFVDAPREWTLDGRPARAAAPTVHQCAHCFRCWSEAGPCPECGWAPAVKPRRRVLVQRAGELVELREGDVKPSRVLPYGKALSAAHTAEQLRLVAAVFPERVTMPVADWIEHKLMLKRAYRGGGWARYGRAA